MSKDRYQGEIATVVRGSGVKQTVNVYVNSKDFPNYDLIILCEDAEHKLPTERVPMNEEIWRKIGKALGYKFIQRKVK